MNVVRLMAHVGALVLAGAVMPVLAATSCPTDAPRIVPYPQAAKAAKQKGVVRIAAQIDVCGRVIEAAIAKGVGDKPLEDALLEAARSWVIAPDGSSPELPVGSTVMPGAIEIPIVLGWKGGEQPMFEMFQWSRARVPVVELQASGMLPGYIADPLPMSPGTYADVMSMLAEHGEQLSAPGASIKSYGTRDGFMGVQWEVFAEGFDFSPAVVRFRWVSDGKHTYRVAAVKCEALDQTNCSKLERLLAGIPQQKADPPAPPPPAEAVERFGF